jgi:hypothetical protein
MENIQFYYSKSCPVVKEFWLENARNGHKFDIIRAINIIGLDGIPHFPPNYHLTNLGDIIESAKIATLIGE